MHQTKYRGIITEAGSLTFSPWESAFWLVKPLRKSVSPFGGDLCFGWLESPRLYLYKPPGCVSAFWKWMPAGKDKTMQYQKVLKMLESIPYLSVGLDVGADFSWMSIMLPNGTLTGKPFKIIHSDPQSREPAVTKIKEAQETYSSKAAASLSPPGSTTSRSCASFAIRVLTAPSLILSLLRNCKKITFNITCLFLR